MRQINTMMTELLRIFSRYEFEKLEKRYQGNYYTKYFTGWQQLIVLLFPQIGGQDSLREIKTSLNMHGAKWYHIGLKGIKRSILSDAMRDRPSGIYERLFYTLLGRYAVNFKGNNRKLKSKLYSVDSTVIDLCISLFNQ